jgi:hypothetical protein
VIRKRSICLLLLGLAAAAFAEGDDVWNAGPLFDEFQLTLTLGERTEILGPLFNSQQEPEIRRWGLPPLFSATHNTGTDSTEYDVFYPVMTYDRAGGEFRFQFFQLLSFAGGRHQEENEARRFTIFPFYFQQRSTIPEDNYTAVWPFYGHLKGRLFRSEVEFVAWPFYSKTVRRPSASALPDDPFLDLGSRFLSARRGAITTYNYVYPFFHRRYGDGLEGWQLWPFYGAEQKTITTRTNQWGDLETIGGHDKRFVLWPFFFDETVDIGTENPRHLQALLPFYAALRSPQRDSTSYIWPFGPAITDDRARQYREVDAPWPLVVFAHGEGKNTKRVWPFYSHAANTNLESGFYCWPVYKYNRIHAAPLERDRTRILLFLWSRTTDRNTQTGVARERTDLWPLYTYRRDVEGNTRLQCLAALEPLLTNGKSIERNYSPLWSVWRAERNAQTGAASQSLLWNLYRRESAPGAKKCSLLFGLFQYQSDSQGRRHRLFYVPVGGRRAPTPPGSP